MENKDRSEPLPPESAAAVDPVGPPVPVTRKDPVLDLLAGTGMLLVLGAGLALPCLTEIGACQGSTRSAKLQWEQRNAEIDRAIAAEETPRSEESL